MKHAVIIVFDGVAPPLEAQKATASTLAEYGVIHDLENVEVYVLDETAIVSAIAAKAIVDAKEAENAVSELEKAIIVIYDEYKDYILSGDLDGFNTALSCKIALEIATNNNSEFIRAIRILSKDEIEKQVTKAMKVKYHLNQKIFATIRRVFYLVCQGRHIVFQ